MEARTWFTPATAWSTSATGTRVRSSRNGRACCGPTALRVAVPTLPSSPTPTRPGPAFAIVQGRLLGGQDYRLNFHAAVFDEPRLRELMGDVGLTDIRRWEPETVDHHDFRTSREAICRIGAKDVKISLNLEGRKR